MELVADQAGERAAEKSSAALGAAPGASPSSYISGTRWKAVWHSHHADELVIVCGRWPGRHTDGRAYYQIEGSTTSVPVDEVELLEQLLNSEPTASQHDQHRINEVRTALSDKNFRAAGHSVIRMQNVRLQKLMQAEIRAVEAGWPAWTPAPAASTDAELSTSPSDAPGAPGIAAEDVPVST